MPAAKDTRDIREHVLTTRIYSCSLPCKAFGAILWRIRSSTSSTSRTSRCPLLGRFGFFSSYVRQTWCMFHQKCELSTKTIAGLLQTEGSTPRCNHRSKNKAKAGQYSLSRRSAPNSLKESAARRRCSMSCAYQKERVPSALPVTTCCSSSPNASAQTRSSEVSYVATHESDRMVHSFINPSAPVDNSCIPEEQNWTRNTEASCPSNVFRHVSARTQLCD